MNNLHELPNYIEDGDIGHIENHNVIHQALKQHDSSLAIKSGFPLKSATEKSRNDKKEVGLLRKSGSYSAGIILAEVNGSSGVLQHLWFAAQCADKNFLLDKGEVHIYVDNSDTPTIVSNLGMFFPATDIDENYHNNRIGRGDGNGQADSSSGYRYTHIPFQKYLKVEIHNNSNEDALIYGSAQYSLLDSIEHYDQQMQFGIETYTDVVVNNEEVTILDKMGSGQVESIVLKYLVDKGTQAPVLEGPINIWIDGVLAQRFSGIEDIFNGGWYKVPAGAYPAGITSNSSEEGFTLYRFFQNAPIFFDESIKITVGIGQIGQGVVNESLEMRFQANVGYWLNEFSQINAPAPGNVIYSTEFENMSGWSNAGSRTPFQIENGKAVITATGTQSDEDARLFRPEMNLPDDYWIETRVRITGEGEEEAFLGIEGAYDVYYGSALHVQLKKHASGAYEVQAKDDFDIIFTETITTGGPIDWVHLAIKKFNGRATTYSSLDGQIWSPLGSWVPTKSGSSIAIGVWNASAEFDKLAVRAIS